MPEPVKKTMRDVFLRKLIHEMEENRNIFFLSADFGAPPLDIIREKFPTRFINVGIAEQNMINVATGLALEGFTVYAYAIAPFITMRCYEQIRVNLAILSQIRKLNVNLIGVGAGYSYVVSGPTHQCLEDLSIMRTLPNIEVFSPADWVTAEHFVSFSIKCNRPKYLRFDAEPVPALYGGSTQPDISTGFSELKKGRSLCIVSTGYMTLKAFSLLNEMEKDGICPGLVDVYMLQSLDTKALAGILAGYSHILSWEEGFINKGGLDALVLNLLKHYSIDTSFINMGVNDGYTFELGDRDYLHNLIRAGEEDFKASVKNIYD
jgi:transketolase